MRVAHVSDHITHAVIGGRQSMDFGISDDPAFFQILSSALYKDPMLAMVRETICNAWDAHLEAGLTDKAISITLTDNYLTIQDFGPGIPDHLIQPIYGVYGASTKKNDGRQTGGFGLGCKSPFAYNDHFEVTSYHAGTKTIYNMSKSSAQVQGKPAIVPIASFPTTDTGISVKIPLNPTAQNHRLAELIRQVVFNGDIKATYNLLALETLEMDQTEYGLVLIPDSVIGGAHHLRSTNNRMSKASRINIRYGNVIYPVELAEQYGDLYKRVHGLLSSHYLCTLVMMAPADSISMTPSRESLTQSDITVQTIQQLLGKFLSIFLKNQQLLFKHKELVNEFVDQAATNEATTLLEKIRLDSWNIPGIPDCIEDNLLTTTDQFAKLDVVLRYSSRRHGMKAKKWFGYIQGYLHKINEAKVFDQGLMMSWARTTQKNLKRITEPNDYFGHNNNRDVRVATGWWHRNVFASLVQKFNAIPDFNINMLYYVSKTHQRYDSYKQETKIIRAKTVRIKNHVNNLIHLLQPTVILCHNSDLLPRRVGGMPKDEFTGTFLQDVYFVYEVSRKRDVLAQVQEAFKNIPGIEFLDMTGRTAGEQNDYEERQKELLADRAAIAAGRVPSTLTPKKVKPGVICLSNLIDGCRINTMQFTTNRDPARVVEPKSAIVISTGKESRTTFPYMNSKTSYALAKLYGDEIAISNKSDAVDRILEKGAMDINAFLKLRIMDVVENSPSMVAYHEATPEKISNYLEAHCNWDRRKEVEAFVKLILSAPEFAHLVPAMPELDEEDQMRWLLWVYIKDRRTDEDIKTLSLKIDEIPLKAEVVIFLDKIIANPCVELVDVKEIRALMPKALSDPNVMAKIVSLITTILN